jgi:hypothetical protein
MNTALLTRTEEARLVATRKLPDDLSLEEYRHLIDSIRTLHRGAQWAKNPREWDGYAADRMPEARLIRAQYGSDWVLILSISGSITGILWSLAKVVREMTEAAKLRQSMGELHDAELRERNANAEKTEAETELLRLQIEERRRALSSQDLIIELHEATVRALIENGDTDAAKRLQPRTGPGSETSNGIARAMIRSIRDLATYGIDLSVEED